MDLSVRTADLEADKPAIIETLYHYLTPASNDERFEWLYTKNPFGPALTWLGFDEANGTVFGVASAFPRRVFINGKIKDGWVLGDFVFTNNIVALDLPSNSNVRVSPALTLTNPECGTTFRVRV